MLLTSIDKKKIFIFFLFFLFFDFIVGFKKQNNNLFLFRSKDSYLKGVWLTTAFWLDWPSVSSVNIKSDKIRIKEQKKQLINKLNNLVNIGVNTVFFQVKPDGTVFCESFFFPYSSLLTGVFGKYPGYDPLKFIIIECHKRNLKIHAWINPYRISLNTKIKIFNLFKNKDGLKKLNLYRLNKNWIKKVSNFLFLDPGIPEVRRLIVHFISELIKKYDIDGIQFDDYFYYETFSDKFNDYETFLKNKKKFKNKADWRRNNTFLLIKDVSLKIRSIKPNVKFGVSPISVWRNFINDPAGSKTSSQNTSYDNCYADVKLWLKNGLLDYVAPQVYSSFVNKSLKYSSIVKWWVDSVKFTKTKLYIGIALYKFGIFIPNQPEWNNKEGLVEIKKQFDFNDKIPEITGVILFRESFLQSTQTKTVVRYLKNKWNP